MNRILLLFALIGLSLSTLAQELQHKHHHGNEIGLATAPVYYLNEKQVSFGLHLHYLHQLKDGPWAIGVGYERIFDSHEHQTVGPVLAYRPIHGLTLAVSPGATFEHDAEHALFALHLEGAYEWDIGRMHLGPNAEVAYDPEDIHLSLGLHMGIDL